MYGVWLNNAIYSFHMPAFFFVSGIFLRPGLKKHGAKQFTVTRLRTIIYPYILWAFIYGAAMLTLGRFMVSTVPLHWGVFLYNIVTANYSWFLPTIFFTLMLGLVTARIPPPVLFVLAVIASLFPLTTNVAFVRDGLMEFPFLVTGMWVGGSYSTIERIPPWAAALGAIPLGWFILAEAMGTLPYTRFHFVPLGLTGTLMLLLVARCLGRSSAARSFAWIGAASFGIFLLSAFPQGGGRELVLRLLHTTAPAPQLLSPTLLAILLPAWLYHRRKRLHIDWLFISPF